VQTSKSIVNHGTTSHVGSIHKD